MMPTKEIEAYKSPTEKKNVYLVIVDHMLMSSDLRLSLLGLVESL